MAVHRFTDRWLQSYVGPDDGRIEFVDALCPSLHLRVSCRTKTFSAMFRLNGKLERRTVGRYPRVTLARAREVTLTILRDAAAGCRACLERSNQSYFRQTWVRRRSCGPLQLRHPSDADCGCCFGLAGAHSCARRWGGRYARRVRPRPAVKCPQLVGSGRSRCCPKRRVGADSGRLLQGSRNPQLCSLDA